jgi:hypothetical protein
MAAFNSDNSIRLFFLINLFSITGLMLVSLPFILGGTQEYILSYIFIALIFFLPVFLFCSILYLIIGKMKLFKLFLVEFIVLFGCFYYLSMFTKPIF